VCLVAGPVCLDSPAGIEQRIDVRSARQMHDAILAQAAQSDIFIAAAAVGDYRPVEEARHKTKKQDGHPLTLELIENPDIVADVAAFEHPPFLVGFAAETEHVEDYARDKLARKKLDMIAANRVGGGLGFESEDNQLTLIWGSGSEILPRSSKRELAQALVDRIAAQFNADRAQSTE
jgi:phosphopantothenoylcysteine decarboxylase/phosphopantothenate--cysteine ligase